MGVGGYILNLFRFCTSEREQFVKINGFISNEISIPSGAH